MVNVDIEFSKPRSEMLGLRITKWDLDSLKELAEKNDSSVTQAAYLILHHGIMEMIPMPDVVDDPDEYKKDPIDPDLRWRVFERDDFRCKKCGSRRFLEADHIVPESKGGRTVMRNLQTLCRRCNTKKGNRV